ncbi:MAG: EAL domain-containing protein [Gammaproteobacteria bacterium]|nr:EAL domain-containing protein [Gammaproteobacteria bacterium]MBU1600623.1 EAL domain-containing protein [Gammaproteobacteria bacterium]MBU2435079.1 EAL domain-containing protein [Gammaproteobacteria bacterium]MBU2448315.1 EAL domain-containing protein [Gammaproteobacteria bacterium]
MRRVGDDDTLANSHAYHALAGVLSNGIARYTTDARIVYFNPGLEAFVGLRLADVIGRRPQEVWPDGRYAQLQETVLTVARSGREIRQELPAPNATGDVTYSLFHFVPERDEAGRVMGVLLLGHNMTERNQVENDLRLAASVFHSANEGIIIVDELGHICKTNPAFSRITGYEASEVLGLGYTFFDRGLNAADLLPTMRKTLQETGSWVGEIEIRRRQGAMATLRMSLVGVADSHDQLTRFIGIFSDVSDLKRHEIELDYIAHHDTLTGLPNRVLLTDRLYQGIAQAQRNEQGLALLFIDIDGFKPVNDNFGHQTGDRVLVEIGQRIQRSLRASDTVARLGGDEFVVLLPGLSSVAESEASARRLLQVIAEPLEVAGYRFSLSASIGVAVYPDDGDDADTLLRRADESMYSAKRTGRNQYLLTGSGLQRADTRQGRTVHELRLALELDQFEVHYQPIVCLATGAVVKAEALVRWRHPERGLIPPAEFIPLAEETGLICAIGSRMFSQAIALAEAWNRQQGGNILRRVSVNRSPREFLDPRGLESWLAILDERGGDVGRMLSVEITEGLLLHDKPSVIKQIDQLREAGITIALDDFGTGFSSLSYLKKFAVDYLKIDRSFVIDIASDPSDRVIVESVVLMARHLGIRVIAEGVETEQQAALLAECNCHFGQGYLYAKPLPADAFMAFVGAASPAIVAIDSP